MEALRVLKRPDEADDEQEGEDELNCPEDCYVAPDDSCANSCGSYAGSCYCDEVCADFGDCCNDLWITINRSPLFLSGTAALLTRHPFFVWRNA